MSPRVLEVSIFNQSYKIVSSDEDCDRLLKLAKILDRKMFDLAKKFPKYSSSRISVLTSLNLLDELFSLKFDYDKIFKHIQKVNDFVACSQPELFS